MVLSTTISQRRWTDVTLYAHAHGKTVSEVVEELLMLGLTQPPFQGFHKAWYERLTPEDTFNELVNGRDKIVPMVKALFEPTP
jgi:hypothetical protein